MSNEDPWELKLNQPTVGAEPYTTDGVIIGIDHAAPEKDSTVSIVMKSLRDIRKLMIGLPPPPPPPPYDPYSFSAEEVAERNQIAAAAAYNAHQAAMQHMNGMLANAIWPSGLGGAPMGNAPVTWTENTPAPAKEEETEIMPLLLAGMQMPELREFIAEVEGQIEEQRAKNKPELISGMQKMLALAKAREVYLDDLTRGTTKDWRHAEFNRSLLIDDLLVGDIGLKQAEFMRAVAAGNLKHSLLKIDGA